jgi:general secretion pathway protein C
MSQVVLAQDLPSAVLADATSVARALGAAGSISTLGAAPVLAASRFVLAGVVAGNSQQGTALIAVDGAAAKPFVVGTRVGDEWFVKSVQSRRAVLVRADAANQMPQEGGAELGLDMPLPVYAMPSTAMAPGTP